MPQSKLHRRIATICRRLERTYGPVAPPEPRPVLDALVAAILSQNTSDRNSRAAMQQLCRRLPDWDAVRRARVRTIAAAIERGGLADRKAPRIKAILQSLHRDRGGLSLEFLHDLPDDEAMDYLTAFDGVGPKTAACVLLFACRKPVLPVDTHVHRVSRRLGLIGPKVDAAKAHDDLAAMVPARLVLEFHVGLIRHGRQRCTARNPRCEGCVLFDRCEEGPRRVGG